MSRSTSPPRVWRRPRSGCPNTILASPSCRSSPTSPRRAPCRWWRGGQRRLGFFSGSTIGNLTHAEAGAFLANAARLLGRGSAFLVGVDLKKDQRILIPAYNDARGVTAAFNLNLLARINRELVATFDLARFAHDAVYDEAQGRIEMYLVSLARQTVRVLGRGFTFAEGERIHTENSHKYTVEEFQALAARAGWTPVKAWTDQDQLFSLHLLRLDHEHSILQASGSAGQCARPPRQRGEAP